MYRVGLTGNVASGKSSVARVWAREGAHIIDADVLAREAVAPGSEGLARVRETFGEDVMDGDSLDRAALRRRVFDDAGARKRLESIIHPEVARLREVKEAALREAGAEIVVHDIPLLFEVGLEDEFDHLVLVDAAPEIREERLVRDRGLDREEARSMIAAQMPASEKRPRADRVIPNEGSLEMLEEAARSAWQEIVELAGAGVGDGWLTVDMHIHTRASYDCLSDPEEVMKRAARVGIDRVCITDHDDVRVAMQLVEAYPDRVIPGEEIKTAEGVDIIGLYLQEWIPGGTPARAACREIRDQGGLVYVPHPFAGGKGGGGALLPELEGLVDVVEGFNARIHRPALNERAQEWGREQGLPLGAGSDAHTLGEIGHGYVRVPAFENTADGFRTALARGTIHGRESSIFVHVASTLAKLVP